MKLIGILLAFSFQFAFATGTQPVCKPSMSVEAAAAIYEQGLQTISATLVEKYEQAYQQHDQVNIQIAQSHDARMSNAEAVYKETIKTILAEMGPEWRKEMAAAVTEYNQSLKSSMEIFNRENAQNMENYTLITQQARLEHNKKAQELANEYNRAVCAAGAQ